MHNNIYKYWIIKKYQGRYIFKSCGLVKCTFFCMERSKRVISKGMFRNVHTILLSSELWGNIDGFVIKSHSLVKRSFHLLKDQRSFNWNMFGNMHRSEWVSEWLSLGAETAWVIQRRYAQNPTEVIMMYTESNTRAVILLVNIVHQ